MKILTTNSSFVLPESEPPANFLPVESPASWQQEVKSALRSLPELLNRLNLTPFLAQDRRFRNIRAVAQFPVFVPLPYFSRIQSGDINDPLLAQVLPTIEEDSSAEGYGIDPLQEAHAKRHPGLLQKYQGRVLLIVTGACAIHCRYCFRRHFPYAEAPKSITQWLPALELIAADPSIEEVILSGGDPLMVVDETLAQLIDRLNAIPHLRRLRIHTRLPIMIPQRVTDELLTMLRESRLRPCIVIHSNHSNELDNQVAAALARLAEAGAMLLNQSVLLRGVNDELETLKQLSLRLLDCRVLPYYLHKNDRVAGTAHFEISQQRGIELVEQLRRYLPGYAVPRFVQEIPGEASKTVLA